MREIMTRFNRLEFDDDPRPQKRTVRDQPDEVDWLHEAVEQRRAGNYENALRYYSRALELDKSLVMGWVGQVQMLVQLGELKEAEMWGRKALEIFPGHGDLQAGRSQALARQGQRPQATAVSDAALQQSGTSAYRWLVRGELLIREPRNVERICFDRAVQADADWLVSLEIALVYLHYDCASKGLERVRRAVQQAPDRPYAWYVQGLCQQELGFSEPARQSFSRVLELAPGHLEADRRLMELDQSGWGVTRLFRRLWGQS